KEWCRSLGALPFPNAGKWLGSTPAGCEVCREACRNESSALDHGLSTSALDGDAIMWGRTRDHTRPMLQKRQKVLARAPPTRETLSRHCLFALKAGLLTVPPRPGVRGSIIVPHQKRRISRV